jgi:hypothetical protein
VAGEGLAGLLAGDVRAGALGGLAQLAGEFDQGQLVHACSIADCGLHVSNNPRERCPCR